MNKVFACIDGRVAITGLCDWAAWAAMRLGIPLELLHVLDRHPEAAPVSDYSGSIGLGAQEALLEQLSALDEKRSKLATEHGRHLLEAARQRAAASGVVEVEVRQRHGTLIETLLDMQPKARLFVMGQDRRVDSVGKVHLDHQVERVVRTVERPVLVAGDAFRPPERFMIAFDASPTGRRMVQMVARSPLLTGLHCDLVMAAEDSAVAQEHLLWGRNSLEQAGFAVHSELTAGEPEAVVLDHIRKESIDLLIMGAYGHSRIRRLIVGSTTTTLLRTSPVTVLILR